MPKDNLYFIAILPPGNISDDIIAFQQDIALHYNSSAALKNMPHITLKAPFKLDAQKHHDMLKWFGSIPVGTGFEITLENFGTFNNRNHPVIYVKPLPDNSLINLQKTVLTAFETQFPGTAISFLEKKFSPHMTIGYRDLEPDEFVKAWNVYKEKQYHAVFRVTEIFLLQHNGKQWNTIAARPLGQ